MKQKKKALWRVLMEEKGSGGLAGQMSRKGAFQLCKRVGLLPKAPRGKVTEKQWMGLVEDGLRSRQ